MTLRIPDVINIRQRYSISRIDELQSAIDSREDFRKDLSLFIYLTGSYGRREAHEYSDLDIFFLHTGKKESDTVSRVDKSLLDAAMIHTARQLSFPEFTKGGIYLDINYLCDMLQTLGSPDDDAENYFTARMLLMLESVPVFNKTLYNETIEHVIDTYYRDYHDHEVDFLPVFLVNDIHRYWKTMCLNYEHARNRRDAMSREQKNKAHIKNFKLKYSRIMTCYSMIISILQMSDGIKPSNIKDLVNMTPIDRLINVSKNDPSLAKLVQSLLDDYAWFLESTAHPEHDLINWISDENERNRIFSKARKFGRQLYKLVAAAPSDSEKLRYLVV